VTKKEIQTITVSGYTAPGAGRSQEHTHYNTFKKMHIVSGWMSLVCEGAAGLSDADFTCGKGTIGMFWTAGVSPGESPTAGQILVGHLQGASNANMAYVELDLPEGCTIEVDVGESISWVTWDNGAVKTQFACMLYFYYE